ncbi:MAG: pantetheine-phosphate adenylyltransferase [Bacteroidetes bacterium]|nr:pantetheine-phosphate adenylyltransferase [Bacteroidota bacterium]
MERTAIFPGSFDPITLGHVEIIRRGLLLFDRIVVGIGINTQKVSMYPAAQRAAWLHTLFTNEPRVQVETFQGLTVHFARQQGAQFLLRGLRAAPDFEYEKNIDLLNQHLAENIQTVYLISSPPTAHISSTLVREVIRFHGNLQGLVPDFMIPEIYADSPASGA